MTKSTQTLPLNLSRKRWDKLAEIAADEGCTVKQLLLILIDEAIEDFDAGDCSTCGGWGEVIEAHEPGGQIGRVIACPTCGDGR